MSEVDLFYFQDQPVPANTQAELNPKTTMPFNDVGVVSQLGKNFFFQKDTDNSTQHPIVASGNKRRIYKKSDNLTVTAMSAESKVETLQSQGVVPDHKPDHKPQKQKVFEEVAPKLDPMKSQNSFISQPQQGPHTAYGQKKMSTSQEQCATIQINQVGSAPRKSVLEDHFTEIALGQTQSNRREDLYDWNLHYLRISNLEIVDKKAFLCRPIQKGRVLECTLRRDKSGFNRFYPEYSVYTSEGIKYLFSAKKRSGNATSNYSISLNKNDLCSKGDDYYGKVRGNFVGTSFSIFDSGYNPEKPEPGRQPRKTISTVQYQSNIFGSKGPRSMSICLPGLVSSQNTSVTTNDINLINKPPRWNPDTKTYVLDFNNRVDKPSVKNFILVQKETQNKYALLFGRVGQDIFNMDVYHPLSPLQAFGIVLSSFDYKIACE